VNADTVGVLVGAVAALALFLTSGPAPLVYDAATYVGSATAWTDGLAPTDGLRGYTTGLIFVPAVLINRSTTLSIELALLVEMSVIMAIVGWLVLPILASRVLARPPKIQDRVAASVLLWLLWGGYASAALTDVPALLLLLSAVLVYWKSDRIMPLVAVGFLGGLAYNLRPAYVLVTFGFVLLAVLDGSGAPRLRGSRGALVLAGIIVALAPQGFINAMNGASGLPPVPPLTGGLVAFQIESGLRYQRYETSLDPSFPSPQLLACDPGGQRLLVNSGVGAPHTIPEYAAILATDPVQGAALVARRIENGVWLDERSPYVLSRSSRNDALGFANVVLLSLVAAFVVAQARAVPRLAILTTMIALACAPAIGTVVEQRFFLPVSAMAIAFAMPVARWHLRHGFARSVATVIGSVAVAVVVSSSTTQTPAFEVPGFVAGLQCAASGYVHPALETRYRYSGLSEPSSSAVL
jgi:hypothetical protein